LDAWHTRQRASQIKAGSHDASTSQLTAAAIA
jgi:hypothetical protein